MALSATAAKAAAMLLTNEKARKTLGWIIAAVLSPLILIIAVLCSLASGGAKHNNLAVQAAFYGTDYSEQVPSEFQSHVAEMQKAFSLLNSEIASVNAQTESGNGLDPIRVKAAFYALCFGEEAPSKREAGRFVGCFYTWEPQENGDDIAVPVSLETAYANLAGEIGRTVTDDDKTNISKIYTIIAGSATSGAYDGSYTRGSGQSIDLDISAFKDSYTKNADDLVTYAIYAWESGWGYVWGTYGDVLTDSLFASKLAQYPDGVGNYADFIRSNWVGGRTTDCVGLIKGYGWLNPDTMSIEYGTNGMPDYGANQMYYSASVSGPISTMPDIPGLAVWHNGHIGVYIGNGEVIEAMGTKYGVVKTKLEGRGWTNWLQIEYINYD
ncbi:hypothetical protein [uncultured Oscillibacter sp.]|uniref:hypothetical protein n=1 Tax=uncultured Oscillibacter sp. TaxID=876091 RepID=UPI0025E2807C|nr:hypothetical protein [uncultured Oscillibacter sp.]